MNYASLIAEHPLPWRIEYVPDGDPDDGRDETDLNLSKEAVILDGKSDEVFDSRALEFLGPMGRLDFCTLIVEAANRLGGAEPAEWTDDLPTTVGRYWICLPHTEEECKAAFLEKIQIREVYQMVGGDGSLWVNGRPLAEVNRLWLWAPLPEPLPPTPAVSE